MLRIFLILITFLGLFKGFSQEEFFEKIFNFGKHFLYKKEDKNQGYAKVKNVIDDENSTEEQTEEQNTLNDQESNIVKNSPLEIFSRENNIESADQKTENCNEEKNNLEKTEEDISQSQNDTIIKDVIENNNIQEDEASYEKDQNIFNDQEGNIEQNSCLDLLFDRENPENTDQKEIIDNDNLIKSVDNKIKKKDQEEVKKISKKEKNCENFIEKKVDKQPVLIDSLKGIILIGALEDLKTDTKDINGVIIENVDVPGKPEELKDKLKAVYIDQPLTPEVIHEIKNEIILYYKYYDHPVVTVLIPKQNITDNVLQVIILESKIDRIYVKNNKFISSDKVLHAIELKPGDCINTQILLTDVYQINKNPFLNANVILKPSEEKHKTDVEIFVEDIKPWRVYLGGDNSGTKFTSENRYFAGFTIGNLTDYNHILSFQYTTSDNFKKFIAYTGNYTMNYKKFSLIFFGGYSIVEPNLTGLKSKGRSSQLSFRVHEPIGKVYLPLQQVFISGFDFKTSNNNISTVQQISKVTITNAADLTQLIFGYKITLNSFAHNLYNLNELYFSPFKLLTHQTDNRYNALHPGAIVKYVYFRMVLDYAYSFYKQWKIHAILRAQASSANLLPSEQFDLGGQDTIRGYENRLVTRDNAILLTGEIRSNPFSILKYKLKKTKDEMILVGFSDFGYGVDHKSINNKGHALLSVGAGIRYTISNNFLARFDWGYPILKVLNNKNSKVYLTATLSY